MFSASCGFGNGLERVKAGRAPFRPVEHANFLTQNGRKFRRLSENEIVFSRSRKAKIITTGAPQEVPLG